MVRKIDCGINIDPKNPYGKPSTQDLQTLGATWVRFTFKDFDEGANPTSFPDYDPVVQDLHQAGINILMILSYETYPNKPPRDASEAEWNAYRAKFAARCGQIAQHYGTQVQAYQIWNESDYLHCSEAYDPCVRSEVFGPLLKDAFDAIKAVSTAKVVVGGLASGQPPYLQKVLDSMNGVLHADAVGVHPYGRRPTPNWPDPDWGFGVLGKLIWDYYKVVPKPIWITEIGHKTDDTDFQAQFLKRTYEAANTGLAEVVPVVFWFCWSDGMVGQFGLLNVYGAKKKPYDEYRAFASQPAAPPIAVTTDDALKAELLAEAEAKQVIRFNPTAALQKEVFADGFVPNSREFDVPLGGEVYRAQRAEHLQTGEARVYYARVPAWDTVLNMTMPSQPELAAATVDSPAVHHSSRQGENVRYIIVHSTATPVGASAEDTLSFLIGPNDREVSAHELVLPGNKTYRMVPDDRAAHQCESHSVRFPDGTPWQLANESTWGLEAFQVVGQNVGQEVLKTTIERIAAACKRLQLDTSRVLGHREIDPDRRSDPVGVNMDTFRAAVAERLLQDALFPAAQSHQVMQFNPNAALQREIFQDGFVPNSGEFEVTLEGVTYTAQRAEHLQSGAVRVYYVQAPDWENVKFVVKD